MSQDTQPNETRPHSIAAASIGSRLAGIHGRGTDHAKLLWFTILVHTPWDDSDRPTWACNQTLANEAGLVCDDGVRQTERALARLRDADMLETSEGRRPGAKRHWGRILAPNITAPVRVLMPEADDMRRLWDVTFAIRKRPASLVTLMTGMYIIAAHGQCGRPRKMWTAVPSSVADLRRFVGASRGSTFTRRLDDLEAAGLISRKHGLEIAPPSKWVVKPARQTTRANECPPMERLPDHVLETMAAAYESEMGVG